MSLRPTQVTSTTVSSMVTSTAPSAWRAISPVSSVTWWRPKEKVFLMDFTMGSCSLGSRARETGAGLARLEGPERQKPRGSDGSVRGARVPAGSLLAQAEALDQRAVRLDVAALQVVEQAAALAH